MIELMSAVLGVVVGVLAMKGFDPLEKRLTATASWLLTVGGVAAGVAIWFAGPVIARTWMENSDDPFFRRTKCAHPEYPRRVDIGTDGFPARLTCVETSNGDYTFVNRTEYPVRLCLGRAGDCTSGHGGPAALNQGVLIRPRESKILSFPRYWFLTDPHPRNYPITLQPEDGSAVRHSDLVVRSENPSSPD